MAVERQIEEMGRLRTANEELLRRVQTSIEQREAAVKAVRDELNGQLSTVRKELLQVHTENALLMSQLVRRVLVPLVALSPFVRGSCGWRRVVFIAGVVACMRDV